MNHDHDHCTGEGCKLKDTCLRYLLTLEKVNFPTYYFNTPPYDGEGCDKYYPATEEQIEEAKKYEY